MLLQLQKPKNFISLKLAATLLLSQSIGNSALRQVIGSQLNLHPIAWQNLNIVPSDLA